VLPKKHKSAILNGKLNGKMKTKKRTTRINTAAFIISAIDSLENMFFRKLIQKAKSKSFEIPIPDAFKKKPDAKIEAKIIAAKIIVFLSIAIFQSLVVFF